MPVKNQFLWNAAKFGIKGMMGPLSLLMGKEIPDLRFFLDFNIFSPNY